MNEILRTEGQKANGTHLLGELHDVSCARIREKLGAPDGGDGYKVDAEWTLLLKTPAAEHIVTIYNWKNGPSYGGSPISEITEWNIGAHDIPSQTAREIMTALWLLLGGHYHISRHFGRV